MKKRIEPSMNNHAVTLQNLPELAGLIHQRMNRKYYEYILREISESLITLDYSISTSANTEDIPSDDMREITEAVHYAFLRSKYPDMPANEIARLFKRDYCDGQPQVVTTDFIEVLAELGLYLKKNNG